ncbi:hypothetical protein [Chitinophaga sp. sic0106]|uniref:hypothetical protein n=1 Tax=Chitinophaga sp. sic0106 TaxID=2854785 RepID=UPI001C473235|nr:hypothetical protein [Chitinophaga sp. sic0106]MBV7532269.1 hypothetical protein [Chitinophaga sp. sic0106]
MNLANFITTLIQDGKVSVDTDISPFSADILAETATILQTYYHNDVQDMPGTAPAFHVDAAVWSATYIYRAAQLTAIRTLGEGDIANLLIPFSGTVNAATIYSADLCLRYLPDLTGLSKSLSPKDKLVEQLLETAAQWPFSSTGIKIPANEIPDPLWQHPSLLAAYADRIIVTRDQSRLHHPAVLQAVLKALGHYQEILWPGFIKP